MGGYWGDLEKTLFGFVTGGGGFFCFGFFYFVPPNFPFTGEKKRGNWGRGGGSFFFSNWGPRPGEDNLGVIYNYFRGYFFKINKVFYDFCLFFKGLWGGEKNPLFFHFKTGIKRGKNPKGGGPPPPNFLKGGGAPPPFFHKNTRGLIGFSRVLGGRNPRAWAGGQGGLLGGAGGNSGNLLTGGGIL